MSRNWQVFPTTSLLASFVNVVMSSFPKQQWWRLVPSTEIRCTTGKGGRDPAKASISQERRPEQTSKVRGMEA